MEFLPQNTTNKLPTPTLMDSCSTQEDLQVSASIKYCKHALTDNIKYVFAIM